MLSSLRRVDFLLAIVLALTAAAPLGVAAASQGGADDAFDALRARAEAYYEEGSYRRALELYQQAESMELSEAESRWVAFRIGDTMWRNQNATNTPDDTHYERARQKLESVLAQYKTQTQHDDLWAKAQRSLGDFWWDRRDSRNWNQGWSHYSQALDYWAGHRDLDAAREAYLDIVFHAAEPSWYEIYPYYRGNIYVPANVLENAAEIAKGDANLAHARYLLAMAMRSQGGWRQQQRVEELFQQVIDIGGRSEWHDDALFFYAEWLSQQGRPVRLENGSWTYRRDYPRALELYRRLVREYEGETPHFDQAQQRIREITTPALGVSVSNVFLPGSEVQYHINWRNIESIDLALYEVDLTSDINWPVQSPQDEAWINHIATRDDARIRTWTKEIEKTGDYEPGSETLTLDDPPGAGAYLLVATAGNLKSRELILVSDATLITKTVADEALVFFCDALDGSPLGGATIVAWEVRQAPNGAWTLHRIEAKTGDDGTALLTLHPTNYSGNVFIAASSGKRQAFAGSWVYSEDEPGSQYRIYAFTDRPAYRPGDEVQWKMTARLYRDSQYSTPANQAIAYEVTDPRGQKIKEDELTLNDFGAAWDAMAVDDTMPLGEYQVNFWTANRASHIGAATLFRLEEYKLPEYEVLVSTGETEAGKPRVYQVGDRVEIEIDAQYYFGAPVANADVEVIVYQRPFWWWWQEPRQYAWLYEDANPYRWHYRGGPGDQIKREQIKTNAEGKAYIAFDTPLNANQDFEYTVEARVVDSSRREVTGSDIVRVTRQKYFVHADAEHRIYSPGDTVTATFKAVDANRNPIEAAGNVQVFRDVWTEIWIAPDGREVTGRELAEEKAKHRWFPPPPPDPNMIGWRLKYRGYRSDLIAEGDVTTDEEGQGTFEFEAEREGYYRIEWRSEKLDLYPVFAQTMVWVCSDDSRIIGYHHGGVDLIVDKDTFRAGETAPVMIATRTNNRHVLFTVEGNELYSHQVVHLTGTVKLVHVEVTDAHIPNIWLSALMADAAQVHSDSEEVIVPPIDHFLNVEVAMAQSTYQPGETGALTIRATDVDGNPVAAEVGLTVVDESIYYIQQELAGDPREFFYSDRQHLAVQTQSTFNQKSYVRLKKNAEDQVIHASVMRNEQAPDDSAMFYAEGEKAAETNMPMEPMRGGRADFAAPASAAAEGRDAGGIGGGGQFDDARMQMDGLGDRELDRQGQGDPRQNEQQAQDDPDAPVRVRSDFRATAAWLPSIRTDDSGEATVEIPFPDSTTRWKAIARVATADSDFGIAEATAQTRQPLIVRVQAPRFFVVGDEALISASINNNTDAPMTARLEAEIVGLDVLGAEIDGRPLEDLRNIEVPANATASIDWRVSANAAGDARIVITARAGEHADAMERSYAVYEHGIEKHLIKSGKVRADDLTIAIDLPEARRDDSTSLSVQITPSMAITMLDAMPYLIDYPYGCTEQTMSRFLPTAIVAKTLESLNVDPALAVARAFGGITDAYAEDHERQKKDLAKLDDMIEKGLARLYDMQQSDGGWGWWKHSESDHYMSAYVVWGLSLALEAGIDVDRNALQRGVEYLQKELIEEERNYDNQAWMLHALAAYQRAQNDNAKTRFEDAAIANLWENRDSLNAYTRALFALAVHTFGDAEKAAILVRNLENGVKIDETPDTSVVMRGARESHGGVIATAHWGADGIYWRWSQGPIESTAFALKALLAIDPDHELIEPVTNWLVKNRRGAQWSNTRDTAIAVLALNDYLRISGELEATLEYELFVNGQSIERRKVTPEDLFKSPSVYEIDPAHLRGGRNEIRIVRHAGESPVYFLADCEFFSEEEPIEAAGHEIFARRDYYKLVPYPTLLKGYEFDRVPMKDGDSVQSGERIEVVLTIEAKNDYEYLVFEDLKPAGLEAVQVQSGTPIYARQLKLAGIERRFDGEAAPDALDAQDVARDDSDYTGRSQNVYQELRDRHIAMFFDRLGEGVWEVGYELRAETPGEFHALPLMGHAMYVPEIRCNSREIRMTVYDRE